MKSPLYYAVLNGHNDAVKLLLAKIAEDYINNELMILGRPNDRIDIFDNYTLIHLDTINN